MNGTESNKPYIYIVTSCKGGIGKSTVTANLADSLARRGKRVLCVDCDYSNRSLDLIFGCSARVGDGLPELVAGTSVPQKVCVDVNGKGLFFIPGPTEAIHFAAAAFSQAVLSAAEAFGCSTVIIDTPGADDGILKEVCPLADTAVIVASHIPTSVRGAEHTSSVLERLGVSDRRLIINRFDAPKVLSGERQGINELIDSTGIMLLGVIPDSAALELAQENGRLISSVKRDKCKTVRAFDEIAARLCGEKLPILSYLNHFKRRRLTDPRRRKKNK